ncbi:hypothetical protein [Comamonas sp. JC664]|uniref:hypothetical protein n=1 Tax=Comamonas sp. JC664 TaxID=2801917 RepID=UPI0036233ED9
MTELILGIESSCDETGVALVRTRGPGTVPELLSHALYSQIEMHRAYGGVVPELASRDHIRRVLPLTQKVLDDAGCTLAQIDAIAFTRGPGSRAPCWWAQAWPAPWLLRWTSGAGRAPPRRPFALAVFERRPARVPLCGPAGFWGAHAADARGRRWPLPDSGRDHR